MALRGQGTEWLLEEDTLEEDVAGSPRGVAQSGGARLSEPLLSRLHSFLLISALCHWARSPLGSLVMGSFHCGNSHPAPWLETVQ